MAAADTCCMRGGWDLSFLDSEAARLSSSRNGDFHHRRSPCRGASATTTTTTAVVPLCCPTSVVPLHSIVRRGSSSHSSRQATPPPPPMTSSGSCGATFPSPNDVTMDHVYENQTTSSDIMRTIVSRGVPCRSTTSSSSSSSLSSSSDDDLPTTTTPSNDDRLHSSSSSFLQTPPSICRSSRSPAVVHTSLVFPPQPSPECATAFTLFSQPTQTNGDVYARVTRSLTFWDDDQLSTAFHRLTLCHFYLGKLSFDEAKVLLKRHPVGTFLLRDSSDDRFPFALSVQTRRGTTSIRIVCECGGRFRLDCEPEQVHLMPSFDCVIALIQFYVRQGGERRTKPNNLVLQEMNGRKDLPVLMRKAYETEVPSLAHLCRKRINGIMGRKSVNRLQLLPSLKDYLNDYPYEI